jgi:hypothetical protein
MKCNTCNSEFKDITGSNQGIGCAASLYLKDGDYYILAHYGSKHDMQRFALKTDKYETGNVCDDCIDKLIEHGKAWVIEDGVW